MCACIFSILLLLLLQTHQTMYDTWVATHRRCIFPTHKVRTDPWPLPKVLLDLYSQCSAVLQAGVSETLTTPYQPTA
jgi:hypothetical protein